jgi:hypothetical protein
VVAASERAVLPSRAWASPCRPTHQQSVAASFPWPADIAERLITTLAHLTDR